MKRLLFTLSVILAAFAARTQTSWPQTLPAPDGGVLKVYEPQPDSIRDNALTWRSAFSLLESGSTNPSLGSFRAVATIETDRDQRLVTILAAKVLQLDLPSVDPAALRRIKAYLESGMAGLSLSLDELLSQLDMTTAEKSLSRDLNTTPPRILYSVKHAILLTIASGGAAGQSGLSIQRATSVVRILQYQYHIAPAKMTAAGRSEYITLASNSTAEGRALNRRTRIVILPQLDQIFKLLEPKG